MTTHVLPAPFPAFGGKSKAAPLIWQRLGNVDSYIEPFCFSAAVLFGRPPPHLTSRRTETINDVHCFVPNFWRAVQADPDAVAHWIDYPVSEVDLFARHLWLVRQAETLQRRLEADPTWYDAQIAGWWCWGACAWIGSGWCDGNGPWTIDEGGQLAVRNAGRGVNRQLPHLGDAGQGEYLRAIAARLRGVRIACGDWSRVVTPAVLHASRDGMAGVVLDPPYGEGAVDYSAGGNADKSVAAAAEAWAVANGNNPKLRIVLCRYADGRQPPSGWESVRWKARKGYQATGAAGNPSREELWCSPHCLQPQLTLWEDDHAA